METDESYLLADGAPQKLEFSITLTSFGPDTSVHESGIGRLF